MLLRSLVSFMWVTIPERAATDSLALGTHGARSASGYRIGWYTEAHAVLGAPTTLSDIDVGTSIRRRWMTWVAPS